MKITQAPEREMAAVSLRSAWDMSRACRPGQRIAHVAVELGPRHQGRDRVDHDDVDRVRAHQGLGDLQRLLAGVGLGDQELVDVDAELLGVDRVERVLGVDEGGDAAQVLGLGDDVQGQRGLAGGLRPVDLDDAAARDARRCRAPRRATSAPVGMTAISSSGPPAPRRMTEPLPNCRSIWEIASSRAWRRSFLLSAIHGSFFLVEVSAAGHASILGRVTKAVNVSIPIQPSRLTSRPDPRAPAVTAEWSCRAPSPSSC